jgi:serine protease SohB
MLETLLQLSVFTAKAVIIVALTLILLAGILAIFSRGKEKLKGRISIKNLNEKYNETKNILLAEILTKDQYKQFQKEEKAQKKLLESTAESRPARNIFVLKFDGDIKASAVSALRREITAILSVATPQDEVVVRLESAGGMVHAYGLAAAQLNRVREKNIPLTVTVDKVAASGGYLMACVADTILAAPFAIIGSIGVIVQMPNFHRLLKEKNIDFEQLTAGNFKRTLTVFGHNTPAGREKLQEEIEEIHNLFKDAIQSYRKQVDINQVATGEHWLGTQALDLKLVDRIETSDDYLVARGAEAKIYKVTYHVKKSLASKLGAAANIAYQKLYSPQL